MYTIGEIASEVNALVKENQADYLIFARTRDPKAWERVFRRMMRIEYLLLSGTSEDSSSHESRWRETIDALTREDPSG